MYEVGARDGDSGLEYQDHVGPTLTVYSESGQVVLVNFATSFSTMRFSRVVIPFCTFNSFLSKRWNRRPSFMTLLAKSSVTEI